MLEIVGTDRWKRSEDNAAALSAAIHRSLAIVEFAPDGTILFANDRFLAMMGYGLDELVGQHHRIFVEHDVAASPDYAAFWKRLAEGDYVAAEFRRKRKDGRDVWIQASYNPVLDPDGVPIKIVKLSTDVTQAKIRSADDAGQIAAIGTTQAVITFSLDGRIQAVNRLFCDAVGYRADELIGRHHSMLVVPGEETTPAYRHFWEDLRRGSSRAGEFSRIAKDGRTVWLQATYTPILDPEGRPFKIVKYATDVTQAKIKSADDAGQIAAIGRSQAVITFTLDGHVQSANPVFCEAMGYREDEIVGRHHRIFVDPREHDGAAYRDFWTTLAQGECRAGEFRRIARDGRYVWLQATYTPILDPEGRPFKIIKYASDITVQVEQRDKFNLLSLVADGTDNSVLITDRDRRITYVNPGFERLTGYRAADVIGRNPGHLLQGRHTDPNTVERIRACLRAEQPFYDEIMNYDRGGKPYWVSLSINPVRNTAGVVDRFISVQANITPTKLKSLDFDMRLSTISDATAIAEWSIDGVCRSTNSFMAARKPVPLAAILSADEIAAIHRGVKVRREILWPDGEPLWLDTTFSTVVDIEGEPERIMMCAIDVTQRRQIAAEAAAAMRTMLDHMTAIVGQLDKVASTTRLLSINATIEAAHAAEAGRGFAVVASEVRSLANQAAGAASAIRKLVDDSKTQVHRLGG